MTNYEATLEASPRTWWDAFWDAVRGFFLYLVYALIDGIVTVVKRLVWDAVYGGWREER